MTSARRASALAAVLKVAQRSKREKQSSGWKCQCSRGSQRLLPPMCRGEKKQSRWHECHDRQLKNMGSGAFVGLGRLGVPAKYREQRCKRQGDEDLRAQSVELLTPHGVTPSPDAHSLILRPAPCLRGRSRLLLEAWLAFPALVKRSDCAGCRAAERRQAD
jgi:hypothetical protein